MDTVYTDEYAFARPYIAAGDMVLWKGKPGKGHLLGPQDVVMIPFSIFWCGFAIFWETTAIMSGAPLVMALFGIPFVCVGLYITVGRFVHSAHMRKRTAYVITRRKIIRARGNKIDVLDGKNLPPYRLYANRDGSGTIRFGENYYYRGGKRYVDNNQFTLENVPDVARVCQIIDSMER